MNDILAMFNAKYGTDLEPRLGKLDEEITELKEAISNYFDKLDYGDTDTSDITDEIGDVLAVMTHVCSLIGTDPLTLFFEAVDKIKRRETDPNYKRTHPHINWEVLTTEIDWEEVRIRAAIEALKGFAANPHDQAANSPVQKLSEWSVQAADSLIAQLKKGGTR